MIEVYLYMLGKKLAKLITHTFNSVSISWLKQLGEIDFKQMSVSI